jgi:hypothetical protein
MTAGLRLIERSPGAVGMVKDCPLSLRPATFTVD